MSKIMRVLLVAAVLALSVVSVIPAFAQDGDGDGVPDASDLCPAEGGKIIDADGCQYAFTDFVTESTGIVAGLGVMPLVVAGAVVALFGALLVATRRGVR